MDSKTWELLNSAKNLEFAGFIKNQHVNGGKPVPLFEMTSSDDDWNASAEAQHRRNIERGYPY